MYPHVVIESGVVVGDDSKIFLNTCIGKYKNIMEQNGK